MDEKELLQRAVSEIRGLRRERDISNARLQMFDDVMSALHGKPALPQNGAMHPDIVYEIEKRLKENG